MCAGRKGRGKGEREGGRRAEREGGGRGRDRGGKGGGKNLSPGGQCLFPEQHAEAGSHEFAAGACAARVLHSVLIQSREVLSSLRECGRWFWRTLSRAAPKPREASAEQVRDVLSQEPRGKLF